MAGESYIGRMHDAAHLAEVGPVVAARLRLDDDAFHLLAAHGTDAPPVDVQLLVDTGASHSFIERRVAQQLRLQRKRLEPVRMANHQEFRCETYDAVLMLPLEGHGGPRMAPLPIRLLGIPTPQTEMPYQGLLGRDFLSRFGFATAHLSGCVGPLWAGHVGHLAGVDE